MSKKRVAKLLLSRHFGKIRDQKKMKKFLMYLTFVFSLWSFQDVLSIEQKRNCGLVAPGTSIDTNCKTVETMPPIFLEGKAKIVTEVTKVECGGTKTTFSQEYIATVSVIKTISGKAPETFQIPFTSYSDGKARPNERKSMLRGDQLEMEVKKFKGGYIVPSQIRPLRTSASMLPRC